MRKTESAKGKVEPAAEKVVWQSVPYLYQQSHIAGKPHHNLMHFSRGTHDALFQKVFIGTQWQNPCMAKLANCITSNNLRSHFRKHARMPAEQSNLIGNVSCPSQLLLQSFKRQIKNQLQCSELQFPNFQLGYILCVGTTIAAAIHTYPNSRKCKLE